MSYEPKDNTGNLFKNSYKSSDRHPSLKGGLRVCCPKCGESSDFDIAAWKKDGRNGEFLSLSIDTPYKAGKPERDDLEVGF